MRFSTPLLVGVLSSVAGCHHAAPPCSEPSTTDPIPVGAPPARDPVATDPIASSPAQDARTLLCARVGVSTRHVAGRDLDLDEHASEGGQAQAYLVESEKGAYLRIEGELLFESARRHFDYRFVDGKLVCARDETTNLNTIAERSAENPEGPEPAWHGELRVYDGEQLVHHTKDHAGSVALGVDEEQVRDLARSLLNSSVSPP